MSGEVRHVGILVDDFSTSAGATDFIVAFVDALVRTAGDRKVSLIFRTPARIRDFISLARAVRGKFRPSQLPGDYLWEERYAYLIDAGMPTLPVFVCERSETELNKLCVRQGIDVVGPFTNPPWRNFVMPWFGYLFDFQHRYLPHFFSPAVIRSRDRMFNKMLRTAKVVVVNAKAVSADIDKFIGSHFANVVSLPFSACPKEIWFDQDSDAIKANYGIAERYFIVCNQFWIHKDHETAIRAFKRVLDSAPDISLVLTGDTTDWRVPGRLEQIHSLLASLQIQENVRILGRVPKLHQIALLRGAIAVLQPTSFEGGPGGGSVFDAIALGVPSIISDIPVNKEISSEVYKYFDLGNEQQLADAMISVLHSGSSFTPPDELLRRGHERRNAMGLKAWEAVLACL